MSEDVSSCHARSARLHWGSWYVADFPLLIKFSIEWIFERYD